MANPENAESLYDRIGGADTIASLIDSFYQKVVKDSELGPYFKDVPMEKLRSMQMEFFSAATGGPVVYTGRPLSQVHRHLSISKREFGLFTEHLIETLKEVGVAEEDSYEIISHVNTYADEITNDSDLGA